MPFQITSGQDLGSFHKETQILWKIVADIVATRLFEYILIQLELLANRYLCNHASPIRTFNALVALQRHARHSQRGIDQTAIRVVWIVRLIRCFRAAAFQSTPATTGVHCGLVPFGSFFFFLCQFGRFRRQLQLSLFSDFLIDERNHSGAAGGINVNAFNTGGSARAYHGAMTTVSNEDSILPFASPPLTYAWASTLKLSVTVIVWAFLTLSG